MPSVSSVRTTGSTFFIGRTGRTPPDSARAADRFQRRLPVHVGCGHECGEPFFSQLFDECDAFGRSHSGDPFPLFATEIVVHARHERKYSDRAGVRQLASRLVPGTAAASGALQYRSCDEAHFPQQRPESLVSPHLRREWMHRQVGHVVIAFLG